MLFAILDYLSYRFRYGKYSEKKVIEEGFINPKREKIDSSHLEPADIVIVHTLNSILSWLVMYYTDSVASHVCTYVGEGKVVDCTTAGIIEHQLSDYFNGNHLIVITRVKSELFKDQNEFHRARETVIERAYSHIGVSFNWFGVVCLWWHIVSAGKRYDLFRWRFYFDYLIFSTLLFLILNFFERILHIKSYPSFSIVLVFLTYSMILFKNLIFKDNGDGCNFIS